MEEKINIRVDELLINSVENPKVIDKEEIHFSWALKSENKRNVFQSAYHIKLMDARTEQEVWESGKVESNVSSAVSYTGPELESDSVYQWKVKIWTTSGEKTEYSEWGTFRTGLSESDWKASFIWGSQEMQENKFTYFRKKFERNKGEIKDAVLYVTAHNDYQLYFNGGFIGAGPARCDPYGYGQYLAYDITEQLEDGDNVFTSLVHWHGVWEDSGTNAKPAFLLEARIHFEDGSVQIIKTDETWKCNTKTPYIEENPVYFGVYGGVRNRPSLRYDARRESEGWREIEYNDSKWEEAQVVDRSTFVLCAQLVAEQKELEFLKPISVEEKDEKYLVTFGHCISGWPQVTLHNNNPGDEIKIQYWEVEQNFGDAGYDTYVCKGGTEVIYMPYVRHTSFYVLEITGLVGVLKKNDVIGIGAYTAANNTGEFMCSDKRMNRVFKMCEQSGRQNCQQGIISVDANREQSPWTADSWNIGMGYLYNHKNTMMIEKVIIDYAIEQQESGNFLSCSPARDYQSEIIEWSLYWPMLLWEQYLFKGNKKILEKYYTNLVEFLAYLEQFRDKKTGLYSPDGWRISDYAGSTIEDGADNIVTNCHIYRALEIAESISEICENPDNAREYKKKAEAVKSSINSNLFVDEERYRTTTSSNQTHPLGTAWAIRFGIVPAENKKKVIKWLESQKENYKIGGYGGDGLYSGLFTAGLGEVARQDFARYDHMLDKNQSNWESFGELSIDNMGNHAWTAYPSYLLQRYVTGISPVAAGYSEIEIRPIIDGLAFAKATVPTVKGEIKVHWEKTQGKNYSCYVEVPPNTKAYLHLPDNHMDKVVIKEGNKIIHAEKNKEDCYLISFEIASGNYRFEISEA